MKKIITFSTVLAIAIAVTSCGSSQEKGGQDSTASKANIKVVYDVPALIGKNIEEVRIVLGKPSGENIEPTKQQLEMNFDSWENSFEKDGKTLLVTFNPQDRTVKDFFISTDDPSGATEDYSDLLKICNVTEDNLNYSVKPVPTLSDGTQYTGIKILKK